jgi:hypothetical protein
MQVEIVIRLLDLILISFSKSKGIEMFLGGRSESEMRITALVWMTLIFWFLMLWKQTNILHMIMSARTMT